MEYETESKRRRKEFKEMEFETECKRKRKTRRGKRKNRSSGCFHNNTSITAVSETDSCAMCRDVISKCHYIHGNLSKKSKRRQLRPRYSPKAPRNSTSFIMDDHIENANGYLDYESPEFNFEQKVDDSWTFSPDYFSRLGCSDDVDVCDVEFENNFTKSLDFMKNDFESAYNASREEELFKLSKNELIKEICKMEDRAEFLSINLDKTIGKTDHENHVGNQNLKMKLNIQSLHEENKSLLVENEALYSMLCKRQ
jgi:hypothetical protein